MATLALHIHFGSFDGMEAWVRAVSRQNYKDL